MDGTAELSALPFGKRLRELRERKRPRPWSIVKACSIAETVFFNLFKFNSETARRFEKGLDGEDRLLEGGRNPLFLVGYAEALGEPATVLSPDVAFSLQMVTVVLEDHWDRWDPDWREKVRAAMRANSTDSPPSD